MINNEPHLKSITFCRKVSVKYHFQLLTVVRHFCWQQASTEFHFWIILSITADLHTNVYVHKQTMLCQPVVRLIFLSHCCSGPTGMHYLMIDKRSTYPPIIPSVLPLTFSCLTPASIVVQRSIEPVSNMSKLEINGNAQRVARPAQISLQNSEVTGPSAPHFYQTLMGHRRC